MSAIALGTTRPLALRIVPSPTAGRPDRPGPIGTELAWLKAPRCSVLPSSAIFRQEGDTPSPRPARASADGSLGPGPGRALPSPHPDRSGRRSDRCGRAGAGPRPFPDRPAVGLMIPIRTGSIGADPRDGFESYPAPMIRQADERCPLSAPRCCGRWPGTGSRKPIGRHGWRPAAAPGWTQYARGPDAVPTHRLASPLTIEARRRGRREDRVAPIATESGCRPGAKPLGKCPAGRYHAFIHRTPTDRGGRDEQPISRHGSVSGAALGRCPPGPGDLHPGPAPALITG